MRIPRSRGAVSGVLLIILGLFGALIPLVGPYFNFTIGPDTAWNFGEGHVWLSVVPGVVVAIGGFILLTSAHRAGAAFGAWLALLGGIWFVVGEQVSQLWNNGTGIAGNAAGGVTQRVVEHLAYFDALGAAIIAFAALGLGRLAVRSVRDVELAREAELDREDGVTTRPRTTRESGRFERDGTAVAAAPAATGTRNTTTGTAGDDRTAVADTTDRTTADPARTDTVSAADRVRAAATRDETTTSGTRRSGGLLGRFRSS